MSDTHTKLVNLFTGIADAIRERSGRTDKITPDNFATAINDIDTSTSRADDLLKDHISTRSYTELNSSKVTSIGNYAFVNYTRLTSVSFPACTTIGSNAFAGCTSLTSVSFPACITIGSNAFAGGCMSLISVSFPDCTTIGSSAFSRCVSLTSVSFPACIIIGSNAFAGCTSLTSVSFPACTSIGNYAFSGCTSLTSVNFPSCTTINVGAFYRCYNLSALYLTGSSICTLANSNAFTSTPFKGYSSYFSGTPYIYVPSSLVASYKTTTNWTYFSSMITGI